MSQDSATEQAIQAAGANAAPRVTPSDIEANIVGQYFFTAAQGVDGADIELMRAADQAAQVTLAPMVEDPQVWRTGECGPLHLLTFCVLVLKNGFTVTGESACASPENFNAEIGRRIARENAVAKIWPLMGYELRSKLTGQQASLFARKADPYTNADIVSWETLPYEDARLFRFSDGTSVKVRHEEIKDADRKDGPDWSFNAALRLHNAATGGKQA